MSVFVSLDGDGTEVRVATAKGKVTKIEDKAKAHNVFIEAEYLEYPLNGWISQDEPLMEIIRKAQETGEEIEVRIESQRKSGIPRDTPIKTLLETNPNKNIIKKLVGVNGTPTGEALTNPAEDPETGRARSALNAPPRTTQASGNGVSVDKETILQTLASLATSREVSENVIDALKAQALLAGATAAEVLAASSIDSEEPPAAQNGFSREAPAFKEHNNDGRLNLGGPSVAAGVGAYNFIAERLYKQTNELPNSGTAEFYTQLLLAIADRIQVSSYGTGFRIDRTAGSHTRIRACIYSVVEHLELPVTNSGTVADKEAVNGFMQLVGKTARQHFLSGVTASQTLASVNAIINSLDEESATEQVSPQETAPEPTQTPEKVQETTVDVRSGIIPPVEAEPVVAAVTAPVDEEPATVNLRGEWFPQDLLPPGAINASNAPDEDLLEEFRNFIIEGVGLQTKAEQAKVAKLLGYTFGKSYSKASSVPADKLADLLDFYVATGAENVKEVLEQL